jgi:CRISPR-associated protein Csx16
MTTWFITRHEGAREWAQRRGFEIDQLIDHLDPGEIQVGDKVLGSLPVNLVAEVCGRGGRYFHLTLPLPPEWRGRELSADDMERFGARLEEFRVTAVLADGEA